MIRNIHEHLPREDEICVELHSVAFWNGGVYEMHRPRLITPLKTRLVWLPIISFRPDIILCG